jgi:hypothetical protein
MRALRLTIAVFALALAAPTAASAGPVLDLDIHHEPTNFEPPSPGSITVQTQTEGSATQNEVQQITVSATEGQFTLSFEGQTTSALEFDASGKEVREALEALPTIGAKNVKNLKLETKGLSRTYPIEFTAALAAKDVPQIEGKSAEGAPLTVVPNATYFFDVRNVGDEETTGAVSVTLQLPAGLSFLSGGGSFSLSSGWADFFEVPLNVPWECPGASPGDTTVTCSTPGPIPRHTLNDGLVVRVTVDPSALGSEASATAEASGGGAPNLATAAEPTPILTSPAPFGILDHSFVPEVLSAELGPTGFKPERRSGAHPVLLTIPLDFASVPAPDGVRAIPAGNVRDVVVDLPPGFLGDPSAVGECSQALFTLGECPGSAQVGRIDAKVTGVAAFKVRIGIFNLTHPRGVVSDIAFAIAANPIHVRASLDPARGYAITTTTANINETTPALHTRLTFWGTPADRSHDSERCRTFKSNSPIADEQNGDTSKECPTDAREPFLTLPSRCDTPPTFLLHDYNSWQNPDVVGPPIDHTLPGPITDCDIAQSGFKPAVEIEPTGEQANTPTGLDVRISVPQNSNPVAQATPPIKHTVVTLPPGMALSPSFADGLVGCSEEAFGISHAGVPDAAPVACPDASRIGEVEGTSPLVPQPVEGSMYLAQQEDNPFGSLFALYVALHDTEERGVLVKLAGEISLDPQTGQITTTFDDLPQLPIGELTLRFRSGPRAPLVSPPTCGAHRIEAQLSSYAQPDVPVDVSNTYQVSEGPGGAPCALSEAARPFEPRLSAGTLNPVAGAFSPLALRVTRSDADQEISTVQGSPPAGLIASLRGVGRCSEARIALARSRSAPGEGRLERRSPSCPAASQVGTVTSGAGAGPEPIYIPGKVYLAGPYKGAPLSGVAIVPAIAGPADLGTIVVRAPVYVDRKSARVRLVSDPLPQIVHGVLVRVRDVRIDLDRPRFTLNPTSCEPKSFEALLRSVTGAIKALSERFQVGDCGALGFKPRLALKLRGGTRRGAHPALRSVYRPRPGDANLQSILVRLPRSAFLDQGHIRTICTRVQFVADKCPTGAIYGHVRAFTPLLDQPLEGPVYLRSSNHDLPDLVFDLRGEIDLEAVARIDSVRGGIRATFSGIPDAPISKVVLAMQGGRKGLIVNSRNICRAAGRAEARLEAHSGRRATLRPKLRAQCGKQRKGKRGRRR